MEKYSKKYMENHCIDVFFNYGVYPIHVLTAGSIIPDELNDILRNRTLQEEVERNEGGGTPVQISTDDAYIQSVIEKHNKVVEDLRQTKQFKRDNAVSQTPSPEQIASRFRFYAGKGFYSYDCSEVKKDGNAVYKLVACPDRLQQVKFNLPDFQPSVIIKSADQSYPKEIVM